MSFILIPSLEPFVKAGGDQVKIWNKNGYGRTFTGRRYTEDWFASSKLMLCLGKPLSEIREPGVKQEYGRNFSIVYGMPDCPHHVKWASCLCEDFSANCGAKTITALHIQSSIQTELGKHLLFLVETFFSQLWSTSLLVGSDRVMVSYDKDNVEQKAFGTCLYAINSYGANYQMGALVHNRNYLDIPNHKICVYWKDLTPNWDAYATEYKQWKDLPN